MSWAGTTCSLGSGGGVGRYSGEAFAASGFGREDAQRVARVVPTAISATMPSSPAAIPAIARALTSRSSCARRFSSMPDRSFDPRVVEREERPLADLAAEHEGPDSGESRRHDEVHPVHEQAAGVERGLDEPD